MDYNQIIAAVILGIVEGITEFLPISSTGHLILFNHWFSFADTRFTKMFDIVIQTGAIFAVILYFRKRILPFYKTQSKNDRECIYDLWWKSLIGFLPAIVVGLLAHDYIEKQLMTPLVVAVALLIWGAVIIYLEYRSIESSKSGEISTVSSIKNLTMPMVITIGFFQCLGMIPGTSRSAATIVGAMLLGANRLVATEFSFFLAIPTLIGAGVYSLFKEITNNNHFDLSDYTALGIGTFVSFLVAWAVIALFMRFIRTHDFRIFGCYRIILGLSVIVWFELY